MRRTPGAGSSRSATSRTRSRIRRGTRGPLGRGRAPAAASGACRRARPRRRGPELVSQGIAQAEAINWPHLAAMNRWTLGTLELSLDEPVLAWQALEDVRARQPGDGSRRSKPSPTPSKRLSAPGGSMPPPSFRDARAGPRSRGSMGRLGIPACWALLLLARRSLQQACAVAEQAAAGFERAGFRLHAGRALLVAGKALRARASGGGEQGVRRRARDLPRPRRRTLGRPVRRRVATGAPAPAAGSRADPC